MIETAHTRNRLRAACRVVGLCLVAMVDLLAAGQCPATDTAPQATPSHAAQVRLVRLYADIQLRWALSGSYVKSLDELVTGKPGDARTDPSAFADPWSKRGLYLRYRVTGEGPEIASIGPDRRWGDWEGEGFFGRDDLVIGAETASTFIDEYLHSVYCLERESGRVTYPVCGDLVGDPLPLAVAQQLLARKAKHRLDGLDLETVILFLWSEWNAGVPLPNVFLAERTTGLRLLCPWWFKGARPTFRDMLDCLAEASPTWLVWVAASDDSWILDFRQVSPDAMALMSVLSVREDKGVADRVTLMLSLHDYDPSKAFLFFPLGARVEKESAAKAQVAQRVLGPHIVVEERDDRFVVSGFRTLSELFFVVDVLGADAPSGDESLRLISHSGSSRAQATE